MTSRALVRRVVIGTLVIVAAVVVLVVYNHLYRQQSAPPFDSDENHFLYGSIGTEAESGVPYWIWLVLPRIFPEYLPPPGGYASLGLLSKDGAEMPVGLSKVTIGYPRVGINCAMCHAASVRASADGVPTIYPAAASHQTDAQAYVRFLVTCAADPRFTPGTILGEIAKNVRLPLVDRVLYRLVIIPNTRRALLQLGEMNAWTRDRPEGGARTSRSLQLAQVRDASPTG